VDYEGTGEVLTSSHPTMADHPEVNTGEMLISEETYDSLPSRFVARKYGTTDSMKLVLTSMTVRTRTIPRKFSTSSANIMSGHLL